MKLRRVAVLAAMLVAASAPLAAAAPAGVVYFLRDAPQGPALPGQLHQVGPPAPYLPPTDPTTYPGGPLQWSQDVAANASKQDADTRLIANGQDAAYPTLFAVANASTRTDRLFGPVVAFLTLPKVPTVHTANLSVELVAITGAQTPLLVGGTTTVLASAQLVIDGSNGTMPDPTSFVPANSTDPQVVAGHIAGQLLLYGITKVTEGYYLVYLDDDVADYIIDVEVPQDAVLALRLRVVPGASPLPFGAAVAQPMVYNHSLTPGLVFVPWYAPDPPAPPAPTKAPTATATPRTPTGTPTKAPAPNGGGDDGGGKGSPGLGMAGLVAVAAAAALLARRRRA